MTSQYTVLGLAEGYRRFPDYEDAKEVALQAENQGCKVEILETCLDRGRRYGSQWTVYKSA